MKAPAAVMKVAMGEAAVLALASTKVEPAAARALGFQWRYKELSEAMNELLGQGRLRPLDWLAASQWVPAQIPEVSAFFAAAENLEQITPPWLNFKILSNSTAVIGAGTRIRYRLKLHGIPVLWESLIKDWIPGRSFVDEQLHGPYSIWHHYHSFEAVGGGTIVHDLVHYKLPVGKLGALSAGWFVDHDVSKIFNYRREAVQKMLGGSRT